MINVTNHITFVGEIMSLGECSKRKYYILRRLWLLHKLFVNFFFFFGRKDSKVIKILIQSDSILLPYSSTVIYKNMKFFS